MNSLASGDDPTSNFASPISGATVQEVHVDFLIWEEFQASLEFLKEFARACFGHDDVSDLEQVQHSVWDQYGEADLIVTYRSTLGERIAILIEDKIGAAFQPDQAENYIRRGDAGCLRGDWARFCTCLVAPAKYIGKDHGFKAAISLETIAGWIGSSDARRLDFRIGVIRRAIEQQGARGPKRTDAAITAFRLKYYETLTRLAPKLSMNKPAPSAESWIQIKYFGLPKNAYIVHKTPMGVVDLTFPNLDQARLHALDARLEYGMKIVPTGKSAAIRIEVPKIEKFDDFRVEEASVVVAINAAMRLAVLCDRERFALTEAIDRE